ncbi:MAG: glycosyltransferase family 4 protein [Chloroflexi bacterium]|nr:glycosyltransferase family 4 protein [Chloroflexota bacterium]
MRIAYLALTDAVTDVRHWSGITYHLYHALSRLTDVVPICIEEPELSAAQRLYFAARKRVTGKKYMQHLHPDVLRRMGEAAQAAAERAGADVAIGGQGWFPYWDSPTVAGAIISDTLYGAKIDYYPKWYRSKLDPQQIHELKWLGERSIERVCKVFVMSEFVFTKSEAELGVGVPPEKRAVTHIGASLRDYAPPADLKRTFAPPWQVIFVGGAWERKGGPILVQTLDRLLALGLDVQLHVVGGRPAEPHERITAHGFLDKSKPEDLRKLIGLYEQSHLFVFPTQADMCSSVLAEASAFSLPAVASRTGGLTDLFEEDQIVYVSPDRFVDEAVPKIISLIESGELESLGRRARQRYEAHLTWDAVAMKIVQGLEPVIG